jgi:hypothetical protein
MTEKSTAIFSDIPGSQRFLPRVTSQLETRRQHFSLDPALLTSKRTQLCKSARRSVHTVITSESTFEIYDNRGCYVNDHRY